MISRNVLGGIVTVLLLIGNLLAQNKMDDDGAIAEFVRSDLRVLATYNSNLPEVDGKIDSYSDARDGKEWIPVVNPDWSEGRHSVAARFKVEWNEKGMYLATAIPHADPAETMPTGHTPDAPFELLLNMDRRDEQVKGEEGRYFLRFVPMVTEPDKMIHRSQAFQFNHRFGDNTDLTDPGLVIWKELSLSGIEPEDVEARWGHLNTIREEGMGIEIFIPWQNIGVKSADPNDVIHFNLEINMPESGRNSWTGTLNTGNQPDGEMMLLPPQKEVTRQAYEKKALNLQTDAKVVTDQDRIPVAYPLGRKTDTRYLIQLYNLKSAEVEKSSPMVERNAGLLQAELSASGIKDGRYQLRVVERATDSVVTERGIYLASGQYRKLLQRNKRLSSRIDSVRSNSKELAWQKGQLARAEYALDQARDGGTAVEDMEQMEYLTGLADNIIEAVAANRKPENIEEGYNHEAGFSAAGKFGPVTIRPSYSNDTARLNVNAGGSTSWEVNPNIYGTFSEPVIFDRPIYGLLYAQELRNPSFEWGHPAFSTTLDRYVYGYNEIEDLAARQIRNGEWVPIVTKDVDKVAAPWVGIGEGNVAFNLHNKAYNTEKSQKISLWGNGFVGVAQVTDLPVWREQNYTFETRLRTDNKATQAKVKLYHGGEVIDKQVFKNISSQWQKYEAQLAAPKIDERQNAFLVTIETQKEGSLYIDQTTLYPADHIKGMDPQVVEQIRELDTGWIRWPGGNFASAYNWREGVGPLSERKSKINPSWIGLTPQLFGTDEYMKFADTANFEPLITVNAGDGTPEEAARWVEYTNGSTDTPMGKLRAENGHPEPYDVTYWNIGNELWGHWQVGYCTPAEYARRYKKFVDKMDEVDSTNKYVAIGWGPFSAGPPVWLDVMLEEVGEKMDIMDIHPYVGIPNTPELSEHERVEALTAVPVAFEKGMMDIRNRMLDMGLEEVDIAIGEYNSSTGNIEPRWRETADLLSYAGWLHTFMRQGEYIMGANATEYSVFDPRALTFDSMHPRYELFRIYRKFMGSKPVKAELQTPVRQSPYRLGMDITPVFNLPEVDAVVMEDPEDGSLGIGLMNRDVENDITVEIELNEFAAEKEAVHYLIRDRDLEDVENTAGLEKRVLDVASSFSVTLPARSVSLLKLEDTDKK